MLKDALILANKVKFMHIETLKILARLDAMDEKIDRRFTVLESEMAVVKKCILILDTKVETLENRMESGFREMDLKFSAVDLRFEAVSHTLEVIQNDMDSIAKLVPFRTHSVQPLNRD